MLDWTSLNQALINAKILSQLDAIGKLLNVIETKSVQKSRSKVKKSVCKPVVMSSISLSPRGRLICKKNCQIYNLCVMIDLFKSKVRTVSKNYRVLIKKVLTQKLSHRGEGQLMYT